jgi:hypothetical protein
VERPHLMSSWQVDDSTTRCRRSADAMQRGVVRAGGGKRQSLPRFDGATGPSEIAMAGGVVVIRQGPTDRPSV